MATTRNVVPECKANSHGVVSSCVLCDSDFKKPKLLPCFHTFCTSCLESYAMKYGKENTFECPTCRREIASRIENLTDNHLICFWSDSSDKEQQCDTCFDYQQKNTASVKCLECDKFMCVSCIASHNRFIKDHKMSPLSGVSLPQVLMSNDVKLYPCPKHKNQKKNIFCRTCDCLVCEICQKDNHKSHFCMSQNSAAILLRKEITDVVEEMKDTICSFEPLLNSMKDHNMRVESDESNLLKNINEHEERVVKEIHALFSELKKQTTFIFNEHHDKIACEEEKVRGYLSSLKNAYRFANNLRQCGQDKDVLKFGKLIQDNHAHIKSLQVNKFADMTVKYTSPKMDETALRKSILGDLKISHSKSIVNSKGSKRRASESDMNISTSQSPIVAPARKRMKSCIDRGSLTTEKTPPTAVTCRNKLRNANIKTPETTPSTPVTSKKQIKGNGGGTSLTNENSTPIPSTSGKQIKGQRKSPKVLTSLNMTSNKKQYELLNSFKCSVGLTSLAFNSDDSLLVCTDDGCACFDTKTGGKLFDLLRPKTVKPKDVWNPCAVSSISTGDIILCQSNDSSVYFYNKQGSFIKKKLMQGPKSPNAVLFSEAEHIFVTDATKQSVFMLSASNLRCIKRTVSGDPKVNLKHPCGIAVNTDKEMIYVTDESFGLFAYDANLTRKWVKSIDQKGFHGICCDEEDNLYIANKRENSVVRFSARDEVFTEILTVHDGMEAPSCVALDRAGNLVVGEESGSIKTYKVISV